MKKYRFTLMNEHDAYAIAQWHYEGIYAFYDMDQDPEDREELLNPENWKRMYRSHAKFLSSMIVGILRD
jgi:ribosomal-protein-alanine N-acetyltransferase